MSFVKQPARQHLTSILKSHRDDHEAEIASVRKCSSGHFVC